MRGFGCALFILWGNIIRAARLEKKLTQQQVADELKIDRSAIAHYENGKSKPHFDNVRKICEILDLTYEDLFDD